MKQPKPRHHGDKAPGGFLTPLGMRANNHNGKVGKHLELCLGERCGSRNVIKEGKGEGDRDGGDAKSN